MCRLHISPISLKLWGTPGTLKYLHPEICGYFIRSLEADPSEARQSLYLITKTWQVPQEALGGEGTRTHMDHCSESEPGRASRLSQAGAHFLY